MYSVLSLLIINTSLTNIFELISNTVIARIYDIQEILCVLIIILLVVLSLFDLKLSVKITVTSISLIILILHYYVLLVVSQHVDLTILPLFIVETTIHGSVVEIDYGQLMVILIIVIWRREIWSLIKLPRKRRCMYIGETSSEVKQ